MLPRKPKPNGTKPRRAKKPKPPEKTELSLKERLVLLSNNPNVSEAVRIFAKQLSEGQTASSDDEPAIRVAPCAPPP